MAGRTQRISVAASVLTIALAIATAVLFLVDDGLGVGFMTDVLVPLLAVTCYAVVGGLITSRLPGNACGWLLLLIGFGLVATMGAEAVSTVALRDGRTALASWALWLNSWLLVATVWPGIVLYLLVFPTGALPSRRWRPFVIGLLASSTRGGPRADGAAVVGRRSTHQPARGLGPASVASGVFLADLPRLRCGRGHRRRLGRRAVPTRRGRPSAGSSDGWRSSRYCPRASSSIAIAAGALGLDRIGDPFGVAFILCLVVGLPSSAAVALLKHHLYGIEVVANRSIVFASMAAIITTIYAVVVAGVGAAVGSGDRPNVFAAVGRDGRGGARVPAGPSTRARIRGPAHLRGPGIPRTSSSRRSPNDWTKRPCQRSCHG